MLIVPVLGQGPQRLKAIGSSLTCALRWHGDPGSLPLEDRAITMSNGSSIFDARLSQPLSPQRSLSCIMSCRPRGLSVRSGGKQETMHMSRGRARGGAAV